MRCAVAALAVAGACGPASRTECADRIVITGWAEPGTRIELRKRRTDLLLDVFVADATGMVILEASKPPGPIDVYAVVGEQRLAFDRYCFAITDVSFR